MDILNYAWLVPALPLCSFILIIALWRPLDIMERRKLGLIKPRAISTGHDIHAAPEKVIDTHKASESAAEHDSHGHAHDEDHGVTTKYAWASSITGVLALMGSFAISIGLLFRFIGDSTLQQTGRTILTWNWINLSFNHLTGSSYGFGFYLDPLSVIMLVVVTAVSMLVHFYSQGYLAGDPGYPRFFAWLSLFTLSMLILVLANNFLLIYIGWELVGVCSYLLIGFWFEKPDPPAAAMKAFITNRVGDFGMLIGIMVLFTATGTFDFVALQAHASAINSTVLTIAMLLILCGSIGKSAQFPLHVWLPDAMEGPTPVSALIHAATMVAAGVYLVARTFTLFSTADPVALQTVAYVGGFTAIFAATIALVQNDIKRVLAYSTISQLGYMFVGLGVADTQAPGMFHLFTHAFFKALLFLGSGSVILGVHHNQDLREMGGLAPKMKVTAITFLMATLSISGFPGFAGFFSKDNIIGLTFEKGDYLLYGITLFTAGLTAFYMFRLWFMTFGGKGGAFGGLWGGEYRGHGEPKEPNWLVKLPLVLLAIPSIFAGYFALNGAFQSFILGNGQAYSFANPFTDPLTYVGILTAFAGIGLAWSMYGLGWRPDIAFTKTAVGFFLYQLLLNKYYIDELYMWIIRGGVLQFDNLCQAFDKYIIDGIVNGVASTITSLGSDFRRIESGQLQSYAIGIFGGVAVLSIALFIFTTLK